MAYRRKSGKGSGRGYSAIHLILMLRTATTVLTVAALIACAGVFMVFYGDQPVRGFAVNVVQTKFQDSMMFKKQAFSYFGRRAGELREEMTGVFDEVSAGVQKYVEGVR